jgi:hypothetical protein
MPVQSLAQRWLIRSVQIAAQPSWLANSIFHHSRGRNFAIMRGNGIDPSQVTFLSTQVTENAYKALISKKISATLLSPPYAEAAEARGS